MTLYTYTCPVCGYEYQSDDRGIVASCGNDACEVVTFRNDPAENTDKSVTEER